MICSSSRGLPNFDFACFPLCLVGVQVIENVAQNYATSSILSLSTDVSIHRELQTTGYEVGEPELTYGGTSLQLVYQLSDQLNPNQVKIIPFSDEACTASIETGNDYLVPSLTYTDDASGATQTLVVLFTIDPVKIQSSPIWEEASDKQFFISLCVGIALYSGDYANDPSATSMYAVDTLVYVKVDFKGDFGTDLNVDPKDPNREVAEQVYFVEGFLCNPENNEPWQFEEPRTQGQSVRVCVKPTDDSLRDQVYMRSIQFFTFVRTDGVPDGQDPITQPAIKDQESANGDATELTCVRGTEICYFDTLLKGEFFFSPGKLEGYGEAWLQVSVWFGVITQRWASKIMFLTLAIFWDDTVWYRAVPQTQDSE
jgi:hypothetical protein